jgi:predicted dinucleotide-binding enzyme
MKRSRREFLKLAGAAAAGVVLVGRPLAVKAAPIAAGRSMKIGIIGSGKIGGTLGGHWARAGHEVLLSARNLNPVRKLVAEIGHKARAGTPREAAAFGEVVLVSVPYAALPQVGRDYAAELRGKVILDTCNPIPRRDGDMAVAARAKGTGVASPGFLPGTRLVRAFNTVSYRALRSEAHRRGEKVAIPLAGDDEAALKIAARLVEDAGFEPVVVGGLSRAIEFDTGTPAYGKALTARELRQRLKIGS